MTATIVNLPSSVKDKGDEIRDQLGLKNTPKPIQFNGLDAVFETGVMATVRVTAERFTFSLKLSDLGLVPTDNKRKDKVMSAIDSVLRATQRGSLLPKDEMWYEKDGVGLPIPTPEVSERRVRMLFPTRYENSDNKLSAHYSFSSWSAVPMNGMTFIPFRNWNAWYEEFQRAKQNHLNSAQILVDNYDRIKRASIRHYLQIALDVYNRLLKTAPDHLERNVVDPNTGNAISERITALEWMRAWKRMISNSWPTKEDILRKYSVEEQFFWAPRPSRVKFDEEVLNYINNMDSKDWTNAEEEYKKWANRRNDLIDVLWSETSFPSDVVSSADEKMALLTITRQVENTQQSQSHELSIAYVRSIVERSESVFLSFLNNVNTQNCEITMAQVNAILRVSDMIKSMSDGVQSLSSIRDQAQKIEEYIDQALPAIASTTQKSRNKRRAVGTALNNLPDIVANAMTVIRDEAESIVGHSARRTIFSDQDPIDVLNGLTENAGIVRRSRRDNGDIDAASFPILASESSSRGSRFLPPDFSAALPAEVEVQ